MLDTKQSVSTVVLTSQHAKVSLSQPASYSYISLN